MGAGAGGAEAGWVGWVCGCVAGGAWVTGAGAGAAAGVVAMAAAGVVAVTAGGDGAGAEAGTAAGWAGPLRRFQRRYP